MKCTSAKNQRTKKKERVVIFFWSLDSLVPQRESHNIDMHTYIMYIYIIIYIYMYNDVYIYIIIHIYIYIYTCIVMYNYTQLYVYIYIHTVHTYNLISLYNLYTMSQIGIQWTTFHIYRLRSTCKNCDPRNIRRGHGVPRLIGAEDFFDLGPGPLGGGQPWFKDGNIPGKIWENMGNIWENMGKYGKYTGKYGKIWEIYGKIWEIYGKIYGNICAAV